MRSLLISTIAVLIFGCNEPKPIFTDIIGQTKDTTSLNGVNSIIVILRDLNPDDRISWRIRRDTTEDLDGDPGWYEFDDVCYGDETYITYVILGVDSSDNENYESRQYNVTVSGPVDTVPPIWLVRK
ncbi:MAG TPA: hypothetical protein EYP58_03165 [bacterium (Candidatus Stahlbacteria)]|nr:hypothetical protein [Candidatus Stahlbacteria bacterium]